MKVALVDLKYPYGGRQIYLNASLVSVAARIGERGHESTLIDFNIEEYGDPFVQETFAQSDIIGMSPLGAPYFSDAVAFVGKIQKDFTGKTTAIGGQVVQRLSRDGFARLFNNSPNVKQIVTDEDVALLVGENPVVLPHPLHVSFIPVWEAMSPERLRRYMDGHEMTLVVSRGCIYQCVFCAAEKDMEEQFRNRKIFEQDLRYLILRAKEFGLSGLQFYATSLNFFQNPKQIGRFLCILAKVQEEMGVKIKVRCLSCMISFLRAKKVLEELIHDGQDEYKNFSNFSDLLQRAGLWCIGFGVDGADEDVWAAQNKRHNKLKDVPVCIRVCRDMGIRTEILMVFGFPEDSVAKLLKTMRNSLRYALESPHVIIRPYLAKVFVPGNEGWTPKIENLMVQEAEKFYNLDYCALGSKLTNPHRRRRWVANFVYTALISLLTPFGKCHATLLLPQGEKGLYGTIAKFFNRIMPSDR